MCNRTPRQPKSFPRRKARPRRPGMTLVELMVVIFILILLVTMLLPSYTRVKVTVYRARSQARLSELAAGAVQFASANKGLYPGQLDPSQLTGNGGKYSGSQVLAVCLFGIRYSDLDSPNDPNASGLYAPYAPGDLITYKDGSNKQWYQSIWDRYSLTPPMMPVSYYPSRLGVSADVRTGLHQYVEKDNAAYTDGNWAVGGSFDGVNGYVTNRGVDGNYVANPGLFLLIGASSDGRYGTPDDVKNFAN